METLKSKSLFNILKAYLIMVSVFIVSNILICLIPHKYIDNNIRESLVILCEEGIFPDKTKNILWVKDNMTDGSMLNIAISGYGMNAIVEAAYNPWSFEGYDLYSPAEAGLMAINTQDNTIPRQSYGRYWHGYQIPLRLLSTTFNIKGIRIFNTVLLWSLFIIVSIILYKKLGISVSVCWLLTFLILGFPAVPLSMQYVACYYITLLAVLSMLLFPKKLMNNTVFYFIIGGLTCYLDFLTVPLVTVGVPLAINILYNNRDLSFKKFCILILSWFCGYGSIWTTKWILQFMIAEPDFYNSVVGAAQVHIIFNFLPDGFLHKYFLITSVLLIVSLVGTLSSYALSYYKKHTTTSKELLVLALIPFVWCFILLGHTVVHNWFTYRTLTVTLFSVMTLIFCKNKVIKKL